MGHIQEGLEDLLITQGAHLIEQQGQNDGRREVEDQVHEGEDQGILQIARPGRELEEILKPLQAHPFAAEDAGEGDVILKGDHDAPHGQILEHDEVEQAGQQQQVQPFIPQQVCAKAPPVFLAGAVH